MRRNIRKEGWRISYTDEVGELTEFWEALIGGPPTPERGETAIIPDFPTDGGRTIYLVLDGDWTAEYEALETWEEAKHFFLAHPEAKSFYSDALETIH